MSSLKDDSKFDSNEIEKWLRNLYLNPLTSYLDETIFRIDLFETEQEYILEALLLDYNSKNISVYIKDGQIQIEAISAEHSEDEKKTRVIDFPFKVIEKDVRATFSEGILEVFVSKIKQGSGKNRYISIIV